MVFTLSYSGGLTSHYILYNITQYTSNSVFLKKNQFFNNEIWLYNTWFSHFKGSPGMPGAPGKDGKVGQPVSWFYDSFKYTPF